jgi:hypothetical protein
MKKIVSFTVTLAGIGILMTSCQSTVDSKSSPKSDLGNDSLKVVTISLQDVQFPVELAKDK